MTRIFYVGKWRSCNSSVLFLRNVLVELLLNILTSQGVLATLDWACTSSIRTVCLVSVYIHTF